MLEETRRKFSLLNNFGKYICIVIIAVALMTIILDVVGFLSVSSHLQGSDCGQALGLFPCGIGFEAFTSPFAAVPAFLSVLTLYGIIHFRSWSILTLAINGALFIIVRVEGANEILGLIFSGLTVLSAPFFWLITRRITQTQAKNVKNLDI